MDSDATSASQYTEYSTSTNSNLDKGAYFGKQFRDVVRTSLKAKKRPSSARPGKIETNVPRNDYTKNISSSILYPGASITPVKS